MTVMLVHGEGEKANLTIMETVGYLTRAQKRQTKVVKKMAWGRKRVSFEGKTGLNSTLSE